MNVATPIEHKVCLYKRHGAHHFHTNFGYIKPIADNLAAIEDSSLQPVSQSDHLGCPTSVPLNCVELGIFIVVYVISSLC